MAGFRTFATGEVLTAANVNDFLMKQSVMVFDDDAARTTALGAEVAEGMLTFNKDTGQLEVFDGSAFVSTAGGLVAVKYAVDPDPSTISTTKGALEPILTINHAVSNASNKVVLIGQLSSTSGDRNFGGGVISADGTAIDLATATGASTRVGAMNNAEGDRINERAVASTTIVNVYSPGSTSSVAYALNAVLISVSPIYINRSDNGTGASDSAVTTTTLTLMEVRV